MWESRKARKLENKKHWAAAGFENPQAKGFVNVSSSIIAKDWV